MALRDPISAYNAANNVEAHLVRNALVASGIEAHVIEDISQVGTWMGGLIPEIHKPQVWIERSDSARAQAILADFEQRSAELRNASTEGVMIEAACEECGERAAFPAVQRGSVQQCPRCGAHLDVGETPEWSEEESPDDPS